MPSFVSRRLVPALIALLLAVPLPAVAARTKPERALGVRVDRLQIVFPQDPEATWFLDTFGYRRSSGRVHRGVDLHAPKGSPLMAIAPGIVTRIGRSRRSGFNIAIDHGSGWSSWYMHLDNDTPGTDDGRGGAETAFAEGLEVGSFVDAGQIIGFVGDSGNAEGTEPHTHFELHQGGRAVDPYGLLVQAFHRAVLTVHARRMAALADRLE